MYIRTTTNSRGVLFHNHRPLAYTVRTIQWPNQQQELTSSQLPPPASSTSPPTSASSPSTAGASNTSPNTDTPASQKSAAKSPFSTLPPTSSACKNAGRSKTSSPSGKPHSTFSPTASSTTLESSAADWRYCQNGRSRRVPCTGIR